MPSRYPTGRRGPSLGPTPSSRTDSRESRGRCTCSDAPRRDPGWRRVRIDHVGQGDGLPVVADHRLCGVGRHLHAAPLRFLASAPPARSAGQGLGDAPPSARERRCRTVKRPGPGAAAAPGGKRPHPALADPVHICDAASDGRSEVRHHRNRHRSMVQHRMRDRPMCLPIAARRTRRPTTSNEASFEASTRWSAARPTTHCSLTPTSGNLHRHGRSASGARFPQSPRGAVSGIDGAGVASEHDRRVPPVDEPQGGPACRGSGQGVLDHLVARSGEVEPQHHRGWRRSGGRVRRCSRGRAVICSAPSMAGGSAFRQTFPGISEGPTAIPRSAVRTRRIAGRPPAG